MAEMFVNTRGRAYECARCGVEMVDVKSRVVAHIYNTHLRLDQAPYYCVAC